MKVIIAGSRGFKDIQDVDTAVFKSCLHITEVVSGAANGIDKLGEQWAEQCGIPVKRFPADWEKYKNSAGAIRNGEMANYADALVAVWDGASKGTLNMINQMVLKKKHVFVYCPV